MSLPVAAEPLEDVRRVLGQSVLMREVWTGKNSTVFQVYRNGDVAAYLKVAPKLGAEHARLQWLDGRLSVPRVLFYGQSEATEWLVLTPLSGLELSSLKHTEPPAQIVGLLADALHLIHGTPDNGCPFGNPSPTSVLTHGDACLPNFLFHQGKLTGVLDVGDAGLGDSSLDLAVAVQSIQFNLGRGYARTFLGAYGLDFSDEFVLDVDAEGNESLQRIKSGQVR